MRRQQDSPWTRVWDSKEQHETWFNENVAPNLPTGDAVSKEYIDLHAVVQA
jgi:hypothetical protein